MIGQFKRDQEKINRAKYQNVQSDEDFLTTPLNTQEQRNKEINVKTIEGLEYKDILPLTSEIRAQVGRNRMGFILSSPIKIFKT